MAFRKTISLNSLNLDGWSMSRFHKFQEAELKITVPIEKDFIGLYFNTGKAHYYKIDGFREGTIHRNRYNILYIPAGSCELTLPKGEYSAFCIEFTPDSFRDFFSGFITSDELRSTFLKRFDSREPLKTLNLKKEIIQDLETF